MTKEELVESILKKHLNQLFSVEQLNEILKTPEDKEQLARKVSNKKEREKLESIDSSKMKSS